MLVGLRKGRKEPGDGKRGGLGTGKLRSGGLGKQASPEGHLLAKTTGNLTWLFRSLKSGFYSGCVQTTPCCPSISVTFLRAI